MEEQHRLARVEHAPERRILERLLQGQRGEHLTEFVEIELPRAIGVKHGEEALVLRGVDAQTRSEQAENLAPLRAAEILLTRVGGHKDTPRLGQLLPRAHDHAHQDRAALTAAVAPRQHGLHHPCSALLRLWQERMLPANALEPPPLLVGDPPLPATPGGAAPERQLDRKRHQRRRAVSITARRRNATRRLLLPLPLLLLLLPLGEELRPPPRLAQALTRLLRGQLCQQLVHHMALRESRHLGACRQRPHPLSTLAQPDVARLHRVEVGVERGAGQQHRRRERGRLCRRTAPKRMQQLCGAVSVV
mmetsp:Transcript_63928/g.175511  ORF Transcript_63928/g.175511 Transcript_63928/m.175511 type:complete len:305 (+) Transcript_63928:2607-3521(+)